MQALSGIRKPITIVLACCGKASCTSTEWFAKPSVRNSMDKAAFSKNSLHNKQCCNSLKH